MSAWRAAGKRCARVGIPAGGAGQAAGGAGQAAGRLAADFGASSDLSLAQYWGAVRPAPPGQPRNSW